MKECEVNLATKVEELMMELSRLNEVLRETNEIIGLLSDKAKNPTVIFGVQSDGMSMEDVSEKLATVLKDTIDSTSPFIY